ncbi:uncharacterized protein LOC125378115 [Haliotis rufescens]|uniref:uncharacterized protein LOC125378115 n=1 Tax=Haliotis rufescens TaxID=6454 RepID=UPI00201EA507|nr:uncharacterized protein LOC125378115 [Haliotis rufescens]
MLKPARPRTIFTDFEKAVQNAVRHVFDCELKGCLFHYRQAVWRNVQKCGLQSAFANNPDVNLFVRRASALPLLRPEDIEDFWFNALEAANMADPSISKLADYVTEQWVEGEDRNMWNHFDTLGPRTTNHVEGWHARINKMTTNHPNIFRFITLIKSEQSMTSLVVRNAPRRNSIAHWSMN